MDTKSLNFKLKVYNDDGYVDIKTLSTIEKHDLEQVLLETLKSGSELEPLQCPVHGLLVNWDKNTALLTTISSCSKKTVADYVNHQAPSSEYYTLELF